MRTAYAQDGDQTLEVRCSRGRAPYGVVVTFCPRPRTPAPLAQYLMNPVSARALAAQLTAYADLAEGETLTEPSERPIEARRRRRRRRRRRATERKGRFQSRRQRRRRRRAGRLDAFLGGAVFAVALDGLRRAFARGGIFRW